MAESAVGLARHAGEVVLRNRVADEGPDHLDRHLGVGPAGKSRDVARLEPRPGSPAHRVRRRGRDPRASRRRSRAAGPRPGWICNALSTCRTDPTQYLQLPLRPGPVCGHGLPQDIDFTCVSEPKQSASGSNRMKSRGCGPPAQGRENGVPARRNGGQKPAKTRHPAYSTTASPPARRCGRPAGVIWVGEASE